MNKEPEREGDIPGDGVQHEAGPGLQQGTARQVSQLYIPYFIFRNTLSWNRLVVFLFLIHDHGHTSNLVTIMFSS